MEKKMFMACCPVCGRSLFRGKSDSYIEGGYPKCKNYLHISYTSDGVQSEVCAVQEEKQKYCVSYVGEDMKRFLI